MNARLFLPLFFALFACADATLDTSESYETRTFYGAIEDGDLSFGVSELEPSSITITLEDCFLGEVCADFSFDGLIGFNLLFVNEDLEGPYSEYVDQGVEVTAKSLDFKTQVPPEELLIDTPVWIEAHGRFTDDELMLVAKVKFGDVPSIKIGEITLTEVAFPID